MEVRQLYKDMMYEKYKKMVYKQALKVAQTYYLQNLELSFQELCSDGFLIFFEVLDRYDETKGSFSTFLGWSLKGIADLHFRENKDVVHFDYGDATLIEENTSLFDTFLKTLEFYDCLNTELSEEAQKVLDYIISNPDKRHTQNSIRNYFRAEYSWAIKKVEAAFAELQGWWRCFIAA